jgi:hypothetical protein
MKLTGKCREDFDKWMSTDFELDENPITINASYEGDMEVYVSDNFDILPNSMKYGVFVDYFDSVGIYPLVIPTVNAYWTFKVIKTIPADLIVTPPFKNVDASDYSTLLEARTAAIEKSNEIYNK